MPTLPQPFKPLPAHLCDFDNEDLPVYLPLPGRWDVNDAGNRNEGESDHIWQLRRRAAATTWAREDEQVRAHAAQVASKNKSKRTNNAVRQARYRERVRNGEIKPQTHRARIAYEEAKAQREALQKQWDEHVENLRQHWLYLNKTEPAAKA